MLLQSYKKGLLITTSEKVLFLNSTGKAKELFCDKNIVCIAASSVSSHIAIATKDKALHILDESFEKVNQLTVNRNVSKLHFCNDSLLVADKSGDVYLYNLNMATDGTLLLGHNSMILDLTTTPCGKYVITCDRDDKIRVSHFPNSYNIAAYCLGHTEFVTNIRVLVNHKILVSTSGDGTIRFWNYFDGKQINILNTSNLINETELDQFFNSLEDVTKGSALPITNLEVYELEETTYIAVSLGGKQKVFLYTFSPENFSCELVSSIDANPSVFCFHEGHLIYVLDSRMCCFKLLGTKNILSQEFLSSLSSNLCNDLDLGMRISKIQGLYKRSFDNLKVYHEFKKQRLTSE